MRGWLPRRMPESLLPGGIDTEVDFRSSDVGHYSMMFLGLVFRAALSK